MKLKRRDFLLLSGAFAGAGLVTLAHKALTGSNPTPKASSIPAMEPSPRVAKLAIAPKGLFAPVKGDVRLVVISDLNSAYGSTSYEPEVDQAIRFIPDWQPDIVLAGGDMVAGQSPSLSQAEIQAMWAAFDRHVAAPLRKAGLPFGFTIGNHDASGALSVSGQFLFKSERDLAAAFWNDRKHDPGLNFVDRAQFPFYYTFQQRDIFYLIWDASTSRIPPAQLAWAEKALASQAAQSARMRIAIGHLPLYAVAVGRDELGEVLTNADQLTAMLKRHRVHTYISGHHHAYYPAHQGELELLHAGALGSGARPLLNANLMPSKTLTVVDANFDTDSMTYTTYDMKTLQVVNHRQLPRLIVGPNGRILRLDVQESDLTPAERSLTFTGR